MDLPNQISSILNPRPRQINNFLSGKMLTAAALSIIKTNLNYLELFHSFQSSLLVYWPSMVLSILLLFYKQLHQMITIHQEDMLNLLEDWCWDSLALHLVLLLVL